MLQYRRIVSVTMTCCQLMQEKRDLVLTVNVGVCGVATVGDLSLHNQSYDCRCQRATPN